MKTVTEKLDGIKGVTDGGVEYWRARDLLQLLGYTEWRNFKNAIERAIDAFGAAGEMSQNHFVETNKMVGTGSVAYRSVQDFFLTRAACYLIAMNGDTTKSEIADAQKYFAVQTRRMEKIERALNDQRRVVTRERVQVHNRKLSQTAKEIGVKRFGLFHGVGIREMYNMPLRKLKERRSLTDKDDWLDRAGVEELAANDFRITQTDSKIKRKQILGESAAISAHEEVGREVRDAIGRLGNTMPEDLPVEIPIKEVKKRLKNKSKALSKG